MVFYVKKEEPNDEEEPAAAIVEAIDKGRKEAAEQGKLLFLNIFYNISCFSAPTKMLLRERNYAD